MLTPDEYLDVLRADLDALVALPPESLDAPVDACPGWTVADLLAHHEGVLRFATAQLRAEPGSDMVEFDPPQDDDDRIDALRRAANALEAELVATDPTEHRPNWAGADEAFFWWRRMAQEAAVHRWDAEAATTGAPRPIPTDLAVDGIDELADVFLAHAKRRGITGDGETIHLHATDEGLADGTGEWMFRFHADGVQVTHEHGKGDMAVRGPASDLLLFVWNRRPIEVETFGDTDALAFWARKVRI